jgi:hypothetical protein
MARRIALPFPGRSLGRVACTETSDRCRPVNIAPARCDSSGGHRAPSSGAVNGRLPPTAPERGSTRPRRGGCRRSYGWKTSRNASKHSSKDDPGARATWLTSLPKRSNFTSACAKPGGPSPPVVRCALQPACAAGAAATAPTLPTARATAARMEKIKRFTRVSLCARNTPPGRPARRSHPTTLLPYGCTVQGFSQGPVRRRTAPKAARDLLRIWRRRRESNPCKRFCRPLPEPLGHVAPDYSPGCPARIRTSVNGSKVRCPTTRRRGKDPGLRLSGRTSRHKNGAEDGTRTRDPHLGKVMLYQLSHFRPLVQ